jgi:hypothetical protein
MSELEMKDEVETEEEFTDELSDEALDREQGGGKSVCGMSVGCRAGN